MDMRNINIILIPQRIRQFTIVSLYSEYSEYLPVGPSYLLILEMLGMEGAEGHGSPFWGVKVFLRSHTAHQEGKECLVPYVYRGKAG